jgi:hypothetical protein
MVASSNLKIIPFPTAKPVGGKIHKKSFKLPEEFETVTATLLQSIEY